MTNSGKKLRIVALMLVIVLTALSLFGCIPPTNNENNENNNSNNNNQSNDNGNTNNGNQDNENGNTNNGNQDNENGNTNNGNQDNENNDDLPNEEHTHAFGEWVTLKEATSSEDGMQERKCECGETEQRVIAASGKEYTVTYRNIKTAEYPTKNGYNSAEGLLELPKIEAEGYKFLGWYTASSGGELVDYIPKGSTQDYILFAHWELVAYEITYKNVPNNTNVTSYNIEDKVKLETPKWSGLVFTHWSDENGNVYNPDGNITALPEGMTGDLTLTANWKVLRNTVTQSENPTFNIGFATDEGYLFFYYQLGTIQHVILDSKEDINNGLYYKSEGIPIEYTLGSTVTISEETAESISNTISTAVSQSTTISSSNHWAENESKNWNSEIGGSFQFDYGINCGFTKNNSISAGMSLEINGKTGKGGTEGTESGWEKSNSTTNSSSTETSKNVSASLAFMKQISTTKQETIYVGEDQPSGYYAFVHAGNIEVYAVVVYDTKTGALSMSTYSYLDNMHSMVMYYPDVTSLNNPSTDVLDFTIPKEEIVNTINNSYYVKYDANGGTGTMPTTVHTVGGNEKLAENQFTNSGYVFGGWTLETESGVSVLQDGQSVTDIAAPLHTVTLKAMWISTEPIWTVKETGTNYYIKPVNNKTEFDREHELFLKYNNEKLESGTDGNTKIVVTEEKFYTYVYWHWAWNNTETGNKWIGDYKNHVLPDGNVATYFMAFESTTNHGKTDPNGVKDNYCYAYNRSKNDGSWWWHRVEVYVQTYTIYEDTNPYTQVN